MILEVPDNERILKATLQTLAPRVNKVPTLWLTDNQLAYTNPYRLNAHYMKDPHALVVTLQSPGQIELEDRTARLSQEILAAFPSVKPDEAAAFADKLAKGTL